MRWRRRTEFPGRPLALRARCQREHDQGQHAAGERHQDQELIVVAGGNHKRQRGGELDVAAAHHARVESAGEQHEHASAAPRAGSPTPGHSGSAIDSQKSGASSATVRLSRFEMVKVRTSITAATTSRIAASRRKQDFGKCAVDHGAHP